MAVVVAGSVPVAALVSSNALTSSVSRSSNGNGRSRIQVSVSHGGSRIVARLAAERSAFLGDSWAEQNSTLSEFGLNNNCHGDGERTITRAQYMGGYQGRGRRGMFFVPFGPSGRGQGQDTAGRREWERTQREQQEKFRQMLEEQIKSRSGGSTGCDALLKEIEMRLRAEEKARERYENGGEPQYSQTEKQGSTAASEPSTYELMKELEKRLRAERETQRERQRVNPRGAGERTEREGRNLRTGNFQSFTDYMTEWDRQMQEQRAKLEEQWRLREESRVQENKDWKEEGRFKDQRRWQ